MRTLRDEPMMGRTGTAGSETAGSELEPRPGLIELTLEKPSQLFHAFPIPHLSVVESSMRKWNNSLCALRKTTPLDNITCSSTLRTKPFSGMTHGVFPKPFGRISPTVAMRRRVPFVHSCDRAGKHLRLELPSFLHVVQQEFSRSGRYPRPLDHLWKKVSLSLAGSQIGDR